MKTDANSYEKNAIPSQILVPIRKKASNCPTYELYMRYYFLNNFVYFWLCWIFIAV